MTRKGIILIITCVFSVIFFHACLTTGDRVNMDEFKRQLEAGGQAISVTQTAGAEAAINTAAAQETAVVAAAVQAQKPVKEAAQEPTREPAAVPTAKPVIKPVIKAAVKPVVKPAPVVNTPVAKIEKQPAVETKKAEPLKKEEPVKQAGGDHKLILAAVFAAALAVFALIAFILTRKKKEEDDEILPGTGIKAPVETPEMAVKEYGRAENTGDQAQGPDSTSQEAPPAVKVLQETDAKFDRMAEEAERGAPVKQPEDAQALAAEQAQKQVNEQTPVIEGKIQEADNFSETKSAVEASPQPPPAVPFPEKQSQYGEGIAGISPTQFAAASQGHAVHLLYKVGGDSPEYRTIKITVPDGWSKPGTLNTDEGYFTATVSGGRLISTAAENMSMLVTVYGLPADTGEVNITYGERRGGSPGVKVQPQPGQATFKIETEGRGSTELKEIVDSPVVDVN